MKEKTFNRLCSCLLFILLLTPLISSQQAALCPDGVRAGLLQCTTDIECRMMDLTCENTPDGKFCCGRATTVAPQTTVKPTTEDPQQAALCPDGMRAGLLKCATDIECRSIDLTCEDTPDGKFCCGRATTVAPQTTPASQQAALCPDGVRAGLLQCTTDVECRSMDLTCEDTPDGKFCCGRATTVAPQTTQTPQKAALCPDGVEAGLVTCTTDVECRSMDLTCEDTPDGKFCCGREPTFAPQMIKKLTTPAPQKAALCPDGVEAGLVSCTTDIECRMMDLTCENTPDGKFCCGRATTVAPQTTPAPQTPVKPTTEDPSPGALCPDGVRAGLVTCTTDVECRSMDLTCEDTPDGKFCCGKGTTVALQTTVAPQATLKPTTEKPQKAALCPDGVEAGLVSCTTDIECRKMDLTCEDTPDGKFCCGKGTTVAPAQTTVMPTTEAPKAEICPDGVAAGLVECKTDTDCLKFQLPCLDTANGKYCCGAAPTTPSIISITTPPPQKTTPKKPEVITQKPEVTTEKPDDPAMCPDGQKAGLVKCTTDVECRKFDLTCEDTPEGKFCCGKGSTPAPQTTLKPTQKPTEKPTDKPTEKPTQKPPQKPTEKPTEKPAQTPTEKPTKPPSDDRCPDNEPALPECKTDVDCRRFQLVCTTIAPGKKFCCAPSATTVQPAAEPPPTKPPPTNPPTKPPTKAPTKPPPKPTPAPVQPTKAGPTDDCVEVLAYECPKKVHLCMRFEYNRLMDKYCQCTCRPYREGCRDKDQACPRKSHLCKRTGPTCADGIDAFIGAPPLTTSTRKTTTRPSSSTVQPTTLPFPTTKTCEFDWKFEAKLFAVCRDIPSDCPKSTSLCSHPAYKDIMARECPASCGLCFPACFDSNPR
ncbi:hypothetical protein M3Y94_01032500 [Aphelenchoides besseyi]|nr:hypothetical protein M3Y94_01032500 [Aphelenchoides besseyi]